MSTTTPTVSTKRLDVALTILRVVVGLVFLVHGGQKLFVYGFGGVQQAFGGMGIPAAAVTGPLVALVEFFGGLALVLGLLVRPAAVALAVTMLVAIFSVHIGKGFFMDKGGIEYALALFAASLSLAFSGAGRASVDRSLASHA